MDEKKGIAKIAKYFVNFQYGFIDRDGAVASCYDRL